MRKYEIVNTLIAKNRYRRYLEIGTPLAGFRFSRIDRTNLSLCHRLMYRCPASFQDGAEITFRSQDDRISQLINPAMSYDLIFIDAHHTLECSLRDLQAALDMLSPEGAIVAHDCCPTRKSAATPWFHPGSWTGVTYCAYIDFVLSHPDLDYYTVDSDFGCGVIKRATSADAPRPTASNPLATLWHSERARQPDIFDFFRQHRKELLHLISIKDFLAMQNARLSPLSRLLHWRDTVAAVLQA
jgi:hypothetical protein